MTYSTTFPKIQTVAKFLLNRANLFPTVPLFRGNSSGSTGGAQSQTTQTACSLSISGSHMRALLQMEGYILLPTGGRHLGRSVTKAVRSDHVVALKLLPHRSGVSATN